MSAIKGEWHLPPATPRKDGVYLVEWSPVILGDETELVLVPFIQALGGWRWGPGTRVLAWHELPERLSRAALGLETGSVL